MDLAGKVWVVSVLFGLIGLGYLVFHGLVALKYHRTLPRLRDVPRVRSWYFLQMVGTGACCGLLGHFWEFVGASVPVGIFLSTLPSGAALRYLHLRWQLQAARRYQRLR